MANAFIKKLQGFASLSAEGVAALKRATAHPSLKRAHTDLIREGDRPGPMFVILSGWACRYKTMPDGSRQVLALLMPGDSCDLNVSLLAEMDHSIQTITECSVATISKDAMITLMTEYPDISRAMYQVQLVGEGVMRAWITSIGRRSGEQRLAHLMCELYLRAFNIGLAASNHVRLPLSQAMIADVLGLTTVHTNRMLKSLREAGAMTLQRGHLTIEDPLKLAQIAGFDENYLHRRLRAVA